MDALVFIREAPKASGLTRSTENVMPIQSYDPPAASLQALQAAARTVPKGHEHVAAMIQETLRQLPQHWPHPVYCVGLKEAASANGPWQGELVGWRYLAHSGNERDYAIEVQVDGTQHQFSELDKGPYIDGVYRVLKDESLQQKTGTTVFKLAVLRLNALGVFAVWLQTVEPGQALFIPLPPTPRYLTPWQQYTTNQFQDVLREKAKEKLANEIQTPDYNQLRNRA